MLNGLQQLDALRWQAKWSPISLFAASEPGLWLDPSDITTMFQDSAGTTPVTAAGQTVNKILDKSGRGNHATSTAGPTYQVDAAGRGYLAFTNHFLVTPTITPGTNKMQIFAGMRKSSDAAQGFVAELSASLAANNGTFTLQAPTSATPTYLFGSKGTTVAGATASAFAAPETAVITGIGDISGPSSIIRRNGTQAAVQGTTQGTGNYLAYPIYIGRRGGASLPFNGRIYSLIVRFGPALAAGQINAAEAWVNQRTGAY